MQGKVQEANRAVFEKNKSISDMFNKNNEMKVQLQMLELQAQETQQNSKLIFDKNKQIGELFNQNNDLKAQMQDLQR